MIVIVDIGGSNVRTAYSSDGKQIDGVKIIHTPTSYDALIQHIVSYVRSAEHASNVLVRHCIIGLPGTREKDGTVLSSPFIPFLVGQNVGTDIQTACGGVFHTTVVNDAFLVGLGERTYGAGAHEEADRCAYITISTGVGGAFFHTDGREIHEMLQGSLQYEPGRQYIGTQTLEALISGHAVQKERGVSPREIIDENFWKEKAHYAGYGIWNLIVLWSPQIIIIGGPMIVRSPGIALAHIEETVHELNTSRIQLPKMMLGTLGDHGGLYGGLALSHLL